MSDYRKNAVLSKIEVSEGVDATPAGATDAVVCAIRGFQPMENEMVERQVELGNWFGHLEDLPVATVMRLGIDVEMVGSGVVDTPPQWGKLLRAAGFAETINVATSVVYSLISSSIPSLTHYVHKDGVRHKMLGSRASRLGLGINPRGIPYFSFEFLGLYGGIADAAFPSQTLTAWKTPVAVNNANTSAFALHSYAGKMYGLQVDLNPRTVYRNVVGGEDVKITDRKPAGRIEIEEPTVTAKDFWTIARAPTLNPLTILHGTVAGYKVQIDAPLAQIINPTRGDRDGTCTLIAGLKLKPTASGNDELVITHK
jgi:hypothetical protein